MIKASDVSLLVAKLASAYIHANISQETIAVYCEFLAEVPLPELRIVIDQTIVEESFFPTVHAILARWRKMKAPETNDVALSQWGNVLRAIRGEGHTWRNVHFKDPITHRVVQGIGWMELCLSVNQVADRSQFIRAYNEMAERNSQKRMETHATRLLMDTYRSASQIMGQLEDSER